MTGFQIQAEVAARHGISRDDLVKGGNQAKFVAARGEAMARCRDELGMSYTRIGRLFRRHHTTVIHAIASHGGPSAAKFVETAVVARQARTIASQGRVIAEQARRIEALAGEIGDLYASGLRPHGQQDLFPPQEKQA